MIHGQVRTETLFFSVLSEGNKKYPRRGIFKIQDGLSEIPAKQIGRGRFPEHVQAF